MKIAPPVLAALMGLMFFPFSTAQERKAGPVAAVATVEPSSLSPGGQGTLQITIKIMEGGHANSNIPADPNMVPTEFTHKAVGEITWARPFYPEPQTVNEWYSADPLSVYLNDSVITVPFTLANSARTKPIALTGVLFIQVCDHEQCYPPTHVTVTAELKVEAAKRK
jgi:DsbC/DsbD-like thiol-disulfide interchange protein